MGYNSAVKHARTPYIAQSAIRELLELAKNAGIDVDKILSGEIIHDNREHGRLCNRL